MPQDHWGRTINYLRISLTDHCNLRCVYCMPLTGLTFIREPDLLTPGEIEDFVRVAANVGFRKIRLTGGEPTLRPELLEIVERLRSIDGIEDLGLTTNGVKLASLAAPLKSAGLDRVNVHLDSLNPARIGEVMRWASLEPVWSGILAAEEAGLRPIKLNAVVVRGLNEEDVVDLARLTLDHDWHVRFVELMPLGGGECARLSISHLVTNIRTRERIEKELGTLEAIENQSPSDEARNFRIPGARGVVGFISPVSEPYCGSCNRLRLTADGKLHLCLLNDEEVDVRHELRAKRSRSLLRTRLLEAVERKPVGHALHEGVGPRVRAMYQIGG